MTSPLRFCVRRQPTHGSDGPTITVSLAVPSDVTCVEEVVAPYKQSGEVTSVLSSIGNGGANRAMVIVSLADWHHRERSQQQIQAELQKKLDKIAGVQVSLVGANSLGIRGGLPSHC